MDIAMLVPVLRVRWWDVHAADTSSTILSISWDDKFISLWGIVPVCHDLWRWYKCVFRSLLCRSPAIVFNKCRKCQFFCLDCLCPAPKERSLLVSSTHRQFFFCFSPLSFTATLSLANCEPLWSHLLQKSAGSECVTLLSTSCAPVTREDTVSWISTS